MPKKKSPKSTSLEAFEEFIDAHLWRIQCALYLTEWNMVASDAKDSTDEWAVTHDPDILFEVKIDYTYLRASICWGKAAKKQWKQGWKWNLINGLVHEVCHVYTNYAFECLPQKEWSNSKFRFLLENATSRVERIANARYREYLKDQGIDYRTGKYKLTKSK